MALVGFFLFPEYWFFPNYVLVSVSYSFCCLFLECLSPNPAYPSIPFPVMKWPRKNRYILHWLIQNLYEIFLYFIYLTILFFFFFWSAVYFVIPYKKYLKGRIGGQFLLHPLSYTSYPILSHFTVVYFKRGGE